MLDVNWSVVMQVGSVIFFAGITIATLKGDSRNQTAQHAELKSDLSTAVRDLNATVAAIAGNSREHGARIEDLSRRMTRAENHIDLGLGHRA